MCEQVEHLRERYEGLEIRRKREAEGYQADINTLKQKLKHVEQQLIRTTITKAKGNVLISMYGGAIGFFRMKIPSFRFSLHSLIWYFNLFNFLYTEHDYIRTIRAYDEELQKLRIKVKQQWQDPWEKDD